MNIFAFDPNYKVSALWLDDIRKNKAILECAQLLSSAIRFYDPTTKLPVYKQTHSGHPCTHWTRASRSNYQWLVSYMQALVDQKFGDHASAALLPYFRDYAKSGEFFKDAPTQFANCAANQDLGISFKHIPDTCLAYRMYINERWKLDTIPLSWAWGKKPSWKEPS